MKAVVGIEIAKGLAKQQLKQPSSSWTKRGLVSLAAACYGWPWWARWAGQRCS